MWGPIPDTSYIDSWEANAIPLLMFHGTEDKAVPYKKFCPPEYPYTRYGSFFIARRYKSLGGCYELNTKNGGGHGDDFNNEFLADKISAFIKNVICNKCQSAEYDSNVSLSFKLKQIFSKEKSHCVSREKRYERASLNADCSLGILANAYF